MNSVIYNPTEKNQACIDICNQCMQACEECMTSCLHEPDVQDRIHCIKMLRDFADICAFTIYGS
ncbi:hypothetical protein [Chengkuizengella marina]|uniref:hypothetical protein n=1 Tax=Chengkuizengella marina TaxID=2507566 RepID=UPI001F1EB5BB|nr:hypothetical protein [Chengkuizengella marina]